MAVKMMLKNIVFADTILVPGSLLLLDFNALQLGAVPANLGLLNNSAWQQAANMIGSGSQATLSSLFYTNLTSPSGIQEITAKKGLHVIMSQTAAVANIGSLISDAPAIRTYLFSNPTHKFYVSYWGALTRLSTYSGANLQTAETAAIYHNMFTRDGNLPAPGANLIGAYNSPAAPNTLGVFHRAMGTNNATGSFSAPLINNQRSQLTFGSYYLNNTTPSGLYSSGELNKAASWVIYRKYIEDLTVSGRTYAQVLAADQALQAAAFAPGGAFYGDTFTAPSTVA